MRRFWKVERNGVGMRVVKEVAKRVLSLHGLTLQIIFSNSTWKLEVF